MNKKKKKFNKLVILSIMIFVFFISLLNKATIAIAETRAYESTSPTHPVGHKIDGAKYWDYHEEYDKSRVITEEGGGRGGSGGGGSGGTGGGTGGSTGSGSGSGTGAGNTGSGGTGNSAGGVGGGLSGTNRGGSGSGQSGTGSGSGTSGGSSNAGASGGTGAGNNEAISARHKLIQSINESREESYARILETAQDKNKAMESILERESMLESLEREKAKESIKAKFNDDTVVKENVVPTESYSEFSGPPKEEESTTARNTFKWFVDFSELFKEQETTRETNPLDKPTLEPVAQDGNVYSNDEIMPSETDSNFYEFTEVETRRNAQYVRPLEPQDFIEQTEQNNQSNNQETIATQEPASNNDKIESVEKKQEENEIKETQKETEEEGSGKEKEKEDLGSEGGKDRKKDADLAGDNSKNNDSSDQGGGGGSGSSDGKNKGVKIIEIDAVGGIGVGKNGQVMDLTKLIMNLILLLCFILGILFHFADFGYRKEVKKGYF